MNEKEIRVRIAPSPTGDPHVGTAYIALFNYVFAKKYNGKFILRIEDTDRARSNPQSEAMIFTALRWIGLQWDEGPDVGGAFGPYRQSERTTLYREAADSLLQRGEAYRCFCTSERLEKLRAEQRAAKLNLGYDRHCRNLASAEIEKNLQSKLPFVVRLKVPLTGQVVVRDQLRGTVEFNAAEIDDQVLLKSDGYPTYHLANVVDDHAMKITHVIRAEEWITSAPKHVLLYQAFGWETPEFFHMPLLRNADHSKISKRKNPVSLRYYMRAGYFAEAMLNYLAMMGWTMPDGREKFSLQEMIDHFSFERMSLGGPIFDLAKLTWLNSQYMHEFDHRTLLEKLRENLFSDDYLLKVLKLVRERIEKLEDFVAYADFFFTGSVCPPTEALIPKGKTAAEIKKIFLQVIESFDAVMNWDHATLETLLREVSEKAGWTSKDLFMPVRMAVTGRSHTPPLFETMELLGKECCRRRMKEALAKLEKTPATQTPHA